MMSNKTIEDLMDDCAANEIESPQSFLDKNDDVYCNSSETKCFYQSKRLYKGVQTNLCHGIAVFEEDAYRCNKKLKND